MKFDYPATLIKLRAKLNLTQMALAKKLGVSFVSINRWENGKYEPTKLVKAKLNLLCQENGIEPVQNLPDFGLIKKVCDLTCTEEDVDRNQTTIHYDTEYAFKKYYSLKTIIGAIDKYLSGEWSDKMLRNWACVYSWILSCGFDDNLKENLTPLENFLKEFIVYDLDGVSFFEEYYYQNEGENPKKVVEGWKEIYEIIDHILQTSSDWKGCSAFFEIEDEVDEDEYDENDEDEFEDSFSNSYIMLVNNKLKEYAILYHHSCGIKYLLNSCHFHLISKDEFMETIKNLNDKQYTVLIKDLEYEQ